MNENNKIENSEQYNLQIKKARKNFISMVITYFLGIFNDNFFKQVVMLIALTSGKKFLQGLAPIVFIVPYLLICLIASSEFLTHFTETIADKYSLDQSFCVAKIIFPL